MTTMLPNKKESPTQTMAMHLYSKLLVAVNFQDLPFGGTSTRWMRRY
jgi:hypothetical protein